jgi:hypothetical protein
MESVPDIVFIIPYRNRQNQLDVFKRHMMQVILTNTSFTYQMVVVHQADDRVFNRGALKNIGFLWCKNKWPNSYKNITLVFHDVDTMPFRPETIDYITEPGRVKHFYGMTFALGGIVSIRAADYESVGGFPNFWGWGFEDNCLNNRVSKAKGMVIDRSQFYPMGSSEILHILDGFEKTVNRREFNEYLSFSPEGWASIYEIVWNPSIIEDNYIFLDISSFKTGREEDKTKTKIHDIRNGPRPFQIGRTNRSWSMF